MFWRTLHLQGTRQAAHSKQQVPLQLCHLPTRIQVPHSKSMLSWNRKQLLQKDFWKFTWSCLSYPYHLALHILHLT